MIIFIWYIIITHEMTSVENNTASTKNIKDNRKVVVASYMTESVYKLPDGIDLEDKTVVEDWEVYRMVLHIKFVDGREETIEPEWVSEHDMKEPDRTHIESAEDYGFCLEYSEDENE